MIEIPAVFALFALVILLFLVCISIGVFTGIIWFMFFLLNKFLLRPIWLLVTGQIYGR